MRATQLGSASGRDGRTPPGCSKAGIAKAGIEKAGTAKACITKAGTAKAGGRPPFAKAAIAKAITALLLVSVATIAAAQADVGHPVAGTWEGAIEIPGSPLAVVVSLAREEGTWTGTIDIPAQGAAGLPLDDVAVEEDTATFKIAGVPGEPTFNGVVEGDSLTGTFSQGGQEFPFTLSRRSASGSSAGDSGAAVDADEEYVDPEGRYTLAVPTGWTVDVEDGYVRVAGPEGGIRVDILVTSSADPQAAVTEAWELTTPDAELETVQTLEPPSAPGVERTLVFNYDSGDGDELYQALAQVVGDQTYIMLIYGELEMVQRRSAQLQIVASGFEIAGVEGADLSGAAALPVSAVIAEFEAFTADLLEDYGIPGASVAIVEGDEIAYLGGFGVTEAGGDEAMTSTTQMMIGSTGKTMTSMLVATLVDDGALDWDTPVVELLPRFAVADEQLSQQITVRNLLCACTGVPRKDLEFLFGYDELSAEGVVESLRTFEFFTAFGEAFQYSNQLVATAGYAAAAAAGAAYGQLSDGYREALAERVLEPIGMANTTLDFAEVLARDDHATPHQIEFATGDYQPIDVGLEGLLTPVEPAGAHWSTAEDMARYLITELNRGVAPGGERVVSEENLLVTWEPQVPVSATESYGLGWIIGEYKGLPRIYHGGNTLGFTSEFMFLPSAELGVAVFANAQGANAFTGVVVERLLELLYDQPAEIEALSDFQVEQMQASLEQQRRQVAERVPLSEALNFFGGYSNPALGEVSLRLADGHLWLDVGEWSVQVRPYLDRQGEADGYVTIGAPISGLTLRFETDDRDVTSMVIGDGLGSYEFTPLSR